jgi:ribosome-associated protein
MTLRSVSSHPDAAMMLSFARECRDILAGKKAEDILLIDLRAVSTYLDFFLICTASSRIQARALAKEIRRFMLENAVTAAVTPDMESEWIVLDFGYLVVHVFTHESRQYYNLEKLWADAERLSS